MPYFGRQASACWSKASACLNAGRHPDWQCEDWFSEIWDLSDRSKVKIESGGYTDTCGAPLKTGEPTTVYEARKKAIALGLKHAGTEKVYQIPIAPKS